MRWLPAWINPQCKIIAKVPGVGEVLLRSSINLERGLVKLAIGLYAGGAWQPVKVVRSRRVERSERFDWPDLGSAHNKFDIQFSLNGGKSLTTSNVPGPVLCLGASAYYFKMLLE